MYFTLSVLKVVTLLKMMYYNIMVFCPLEQNVLYLYGMTGFISALELNYDVRVTLFRNWF